MAVSDKMTPRTIAEQSKLKGLDFVATADCLHPRWVEMLKNELTETDRGVLAHKESDIKFVLSTEVEDNRRVHHLIFLPDYNAVDKLYNEFAKYSKDIDADGRAHIRLDGEKIAEKVIDLGGLIGPSHAFVPWTSIFKEYDSIKECYKNFSDDICFLELGLSADSEMADNISKEIERLQA